LYTSFTGKSLICGLAKPIILNMNTFILWDQSAELFSWGSFTLRWDGVLLLVAFLVGKQMLTYFYKTENKSRKDADVLVTYLVIAAFISSRLGHALFYQPELWKRPLSIFLPFEFKPFQLVGMSGFSSIGAVIGILVAIWLYSRKKKDGQNFLQTLDRVSIISLWIAALILVGSFLNSKIEGKPTSSFVGTVFTNPIAKGILELPCCIMRNPGGKNPLTKVVALKDNKQPSETNTGFKSIVFYLFIKPGTTQRVVEEFLQGDVKTYLYEMSQFVVEPGTKPLQYTIFNEPNGDIEVRVATIGIARHPVQLYESISTLFLLAVLFWYWNKHKLNLHQGTIAGICLITFWALRFMFEFLKQDQASFLIGLGINKSQILCIPLIMIGAAILFVSRKE
jgi:phosphatidylglycerol---prolipoprotein diacylglyceryl transferase